MRKSLFPILTPLLLAVAPVSAATVWDVVEGPGGSTKGAWSLAGDGSNGSARMATMTGQTVTYGVAGSQSNGGYTFQRVNPSDATSCTYHGQATGTGKIVGSRICGGSASVWIATPH